MKYTHAQLALFWWNFPGELPHRPEIPAIFEHLEESGLIPENAWDAEYRNGRGEFESRCYTYGPFIITDGESELAIHTCGNQSGGIDVLVVFSQCDGWITTKRARFQALDAIKPAGYIQEPH